jgi:hypothetical protein
LWFKRAVQTTGLTSGWARNLRISRSRHPQRSFPTKAAEDDASLQDFYHPLSIIDIVGKELPRPSTFWEFQAFLNDSKNHSETMAPWLIYDIASRGAQFLEDEGIQMEEYGALPGVGNELALKQICSVLIITSHLGLEFYLNAVSLVPLHASYGPHNGGTFLKCQHTKLR